jgi:hypothetical protein
MAIFHLCEHPAAVFHVPLDPPEMCSGKQDEFLPDIMANSSKTASGHVTSKSKSQFLSGFYGRSASNMPLGR